MSITYQRKLPHWQPDESTFFVTYRLFGSLPTSVLNGLADMKASIMRAAGNDSEQIRVARKRYFGQFDHVLDQATNGPYWLREEKVAQIVMDSWRYWDNQHYCLYAVCIMPNHVHSLFRLLPDAPPLYKVLQSIKTFSGRESNLVLRLTGQPFWARESYDHFVRKDGEFERIGHYILQNPVKAGFVKESGDWRWSYKKEGVEF